MIELKANQEEQQIIAWRPPFILCDLRGQNPLHLIFFDLKRIPSIL